MTLEFGSSRFLRSATDRKKAGVGSKIGITIFLSVFFLMGMGFLALITNEIYKVARTYTFSETVGVIESSSIDQQMHKDNPYTIKVRYHYGVNQRNYTSTVYSAGDSSFSDYSDAQRLKLKYEPGAKVKVYYNSSHPSEAVLAHGSLFMIPFAIIPLIFVAIGGFGIYGVWFVKDADEEGSGKSISSSAPSKSGSWSKYGLAFFFFIFFAAGVGVSFPLIITPLYKHLHSEDWVRAPAVVESSRVKSHSSDDGTTYSVDILFSYQVNGRTFKSNNYDFSSGSSSGYSSKKQIVEMYPAGMRFKCFVNPDDPTEAVISRNLDTTMMLFGLLPLIFIAVGAGGMYAALTGKMQGDSQRRALSARVQAKGRRASSSASSVGEALSMASAMHAEQKGTRVVASDLENLPHWAPELTSYEVLPSGEIQLNPMVSAKVKIIGMTAFAVVWNAIIGGIMLAEGSSMFSGFGIVMLLFFIPFVLVGIGTILGVFYFILAASNARPSLTLKSLKVYPDIPFRVNWHLQGKVENISKFKITIKGVEEASYRRGTDTVTDRETFYEDTVVAYGKHADIRNGNVDITLPKSVMHSFACDNNRIKWSLEVHGEIEKWPDVNENFPLLVMPASSSRKV